MSRTARLWVVLAANLALVAALVVVGFVANSVGVFAAGIDYVADAAAIGVSLLAIHLAVAGAIIYEVRGVYWLDPAVALVIALVVGYQAALLLNRISVAPHHGFA
jgi:Co/Zn/Cd efflux system component